MIVKALLNSDGSHHVLCPVKCLYEYVAATNKFRSSALFVNPISGVPCNRDRIVYFFRKLITLAQPGVFARFQVLRNLASWKAFWSRITVSSIKYRGFWKSNNALARRCLAGSTPSNETCVALGEVCH